MILTVAVLRLETLNWLDYLILAIFFAVNLGIGCWCSRRSQSSSDNYLRGGGRISWWAAGVSFFATASSSISVMALPARSYSSNWLSFGSAPAQAGAAIVIAFVFVSLLRRLNITTIFEYLEFRFNRSVRIWGAIFTLMLKVLGRISVVVLLPSLALSTVTGLNVYASIFLLGGVTIIYAMVGGFDAVIWTDVVQVGVLLGGMALVLFYVTRGVPHGIPGVLSMAAAHDKLHPVSWAWDFDHPTFWVFVGMGLGSIFQQMSDQPLMQRVFATPNPRAARNAVLLGVGIAIPTSIFFFFLGTALFVFYHFHPNRLTALSSPDYVVPYFIVNELPHGLVGLIVAGIFASAMGTISSVINATATIVKTDCFDLLFPLAKDGQQVAFARWATLVSGALGVAMAAYIASLHVLSLWDKYLQLIALIGGGLPGVFALGLLTKRANATGVIIGLLSSIAITWYVQHYTAIDTFLDSFVAVAAAIIIGYLASLVFPSREAQRDLRGLTVWQPPKPAGRPGKRQRDVKSTSPIISPS